MNYGDVFLALAKAIPDKPALIHGDVRLSWSEFDARSSRLANHLHGLGLKRLDKVAFYLANSCVYSELLAACFKGAFTHVNVNYRYVSGELHYILDNSDSRVVCYHQRFAPQVAELRPTLPDVELWLEVTDEPGADPVNSFAVSYERIVAGPASCELSPDLKRSDEDLLFIYTGGTTGLPKGVMWEHTMLWEASLAATFEEPVESVEAMQQAVAAAKGHHIFVPACPQMHGTGMITTINALAQGACIVTLDVPKFDPHALWECVQQHGVTQIAIVGDAFANPMLRALGEADYDISSLQTIISSGIMWSPENKRGLLEHNPQMLLVDSFGSSEAIGFGSSVSSSEGTEEVAKFEIGPTCKVFTEDLREVRPGSGEVGFIARSGPIPLGYYKDEAKTAKTFITVDGVRYSMPGDWCSVEADGTLTLLGRGSVCINSGGEKIYPEEVEEALKRHAAVRDALVVGVPSERWGQAVTALIELEPGSETPGEDALIAHVRTQLAAYKAPKSVLEVPAMFRAANGKADYAGARTHALEALGIAE
ncbi:MAG: acyl-CoA synthetase [Gammaproteobacteria bacterium AqS3]|nr:acyl-CoA synthetase [Gammaproteobacteria bacterium AqS3]